MRKEAHIKAVGGSGQRDSGIMSDGIRYFEKLPQNFIIIKNFVS
jgi:hypothetical protein